MKVLYLDCFSGAAGDMLLGALVDAGVPLGDLRDALGSLAVDDDGVGGDTVWTERVNRAGVTATKLCVRGEDEPHARQRPADDSHRQGDHGHRHEHGHAHDHEQSHVATATRHVHAHRSLREIGRLVDRSALSAEGKARAKDLFGRLGEAEAAIHGTSLEDVHLHEVGALDSIIDIVGTVFALESLRLDRIVSSPLNVGSGTVRSAHGLYPVPAPATARLLRGAPIYAGAQQAELVTPTGALLVTGYAHSYGPVPAMRLDAVGYGAGSRDFRDTPNVLRVLVGEADGAAPAHAVVVIEAEIDDMNPQIFGLLMDRLLADGALDVYYTPIQMKKNRPGTLVTAIASPGLREKVTSTIFRETTTIGVRYREMTRECLDREAVIVETSGGSVRIKVARRGGEILNAAPEFDDCARIATDTGRPVKDVQAAAMKAFLDRRS
ncbi:MAG: nickel pincer cofactor biosynthesis protein LarC [Vicinamibacterales bacterium]